jgi:hypothetical protein
MWDCCLSFIVNDFITAPLQALKFSIMGLGSAEMDKR